MLAAWAYLTINTFRCEDVLQLLVMENVTCIFARCKQITMHCPEAFLFAATYVSVTTLPITDTLLHSPLPTTSPAPGACEDPSIVDLNNTKNCCMICAAMSLRLLLLAMHESPTSYRGCVAPPQECLNVSDFGCLIDECCKLLLA